MNIFFTVLKLKFYACHLQKCCGHRDISIEERPGRKTRYIRFILLWTASSCIWKNWGMGLSGSRPFQAICNNLTGVLNTTNCPCKHQFFIRSDEATGAVENS